MRNAAWVISGDVFADRNVEMVPSSSADSVSTRVCANVFVEDEHAHKTACVVHASEMCVKGLAISKTSWDFQK